MLWGEQELNQRPAKKRGGGGGGSWQVLMPDLQQTHGARVYGCPARHLGTGNRSRDGDRQRRGCKGRKNMRRRDRRAWGSREVPVTMGWVRMQKQV